MLTIIIPSIEMFNEKTQEFLTTKEQTLQLEHSLVSISKWESKWNKSFLYSKEKSVDEIVDYIKCMTITQNIKDDIYYRLTSSNIDEIYKYINEPMTATKFSENGSSNNQEIITSELIYYWMFALNIPMECQKWHLNRLLTLIRVCQIKSAPPKKRSEKEITFRNAELNAARRKQLGTNG